MPHKVGECTRHGHEIHSQNIVVIDSDWIGRGKSNYNIIEAAEEPLCQKHACRFY